MGSTFQVGGSKQIGQQRPNLFFSTARGSNSLGPSGAKPIKAGSVAMDLDLDMKKFKTWHNFNAEFEKRLGAKERANVLNLKKQKGEDFKYPSTLWRGSMKT